MHPLNKLHVYGQAQALVSAVRQQCESISDRDLQWQLMRAVRSIAANLAEGAGSESQAAFARYVAIAIGSAKETESHLGMAVEAGLISAEVHQLLVARLNQLTPRLVALLTALRRNASRKSREIP